MHRILLLMFLVSANSAWPQKNVTRGVFSNGGGNTESTLFAIRGSLGQTVVGATTDSIRAAQAGFWPIHAGKITALAPASHAHIPNTFFLRQNYPNPFNPSTTIEFAVPRAIRVKIALFDLLGRQVATLVDADYQAGHYRIHFEPLDLAGGLYVYRIQAGTFRQTRKLMLLK